MASTMTTPETLSEQFGHVRDRLPGADVPWLSAMREAGLDRFAALGWPNTKTEAWKYTSLQNVQTIPFGLGRSAEPASKVTVVPCLFDGEKAGHRLVLVNDHFNKNLSALQGLPKGVVVSSLAGILKTEPGIVEPYLGSIGALDSQPLLALNTAFMNDGFVIKISKNTVLDSPLEIVFIGGFEDDTVIHNMRNLIIMEENSQATIVENHVGMPSSGCVDNEVCEIHVDQGARLNHYKLESEGANATHLNTAHVDVARDATYEAFLLTIGGMLSRNEKTVRLKGEGAHCAINGAFLLRGKQHCDNTTVIEHLVPRTTSREVFKGALDGESRGVFQGRIVVHKDAQQTDGHQMCKTLLLSDKAEMDAKPELEIYADDVKCSHGATAGQIDETALFYLRSRGIPEVAARELLIEAFLGEALDEISDDSVRQLLRNKVGHWLARDI
ncbi:MAG: Fe-S cluster assembly protein SufD [Rhodospirillales bacterium]